MKTKPDDYQVHLFHDGTYFRSYEIFGAQLITTDAGQGVAFTVWAPQAQKVSVVGDFNDWKGHQHGMEKINAEGIWHLFIPHLQTGDCYKYEILTCDGQKRLKADPYGTYAEIRPQTASVVYSLEGYKWKDNKWKREQKNKNWQQAPLNIYEFNMGSWKKKGIKVATEKYDESDIHSFYTYREIAEVLIPYLKAHKFTHVEVMPLVEHPYDRSWGYQGTGYYSVTSRYGNPHDFMYLVDQCHQAGIGVLIDWVPGHFCKDDHGLYLFDGAPTYEYRHASVRENPTWGTANFDLGRKEVQSFLISNALFWLEYFHIDGFRIDAVANMLYWEPHGHPEKNELAVHFLQKLNEAIHLHYPEALVCAEDSTDWPGVTASVAGGGLGFDYKWNMGWMNDVLSYMEASPYDRKYHHHKMTFSMLYAFSEKYILPLSHDEVVHGKKSLLNKMPGDDWQKFAQLRLLYGYMYTHPGKKLLFMGGEFGQFDEWKDMEQLDWMILEYDKHAQMNTFTKDLFAFYKRSKPLYERDHQPDGFSWIDVDNHEQSIFSFIRKAEDDYLVIVCNFTPETYHHYKVGVPSHDRYREILNSDDIKYGGSGQINGGSGRADKYYLETIDQQYHHQPCHLELTVPPLGILILRPVKKLDKKVSRHVNELKA
ncbi:MAG: 1,4-alpha-glucan branching protein GlgB [Defluviitaleaceae bacterium]|nr:1,4-alpha-glucan branching protein GlgB [Defluviitaleaceae bacterium]